MNSAKQLQDMPPEAKATLELLEAWGYSAKYLFGEKHHIVVYVPEDLKLKVAEIALSLWLKWSMLDNLSGDEEITAEFHPQAGVAEIHCYNMIVQP